MAGKSVAVVCALALLLAAVSADDVASLKSLQKCVQANADNKKYLMGWGVKGGPGSANGVAAAIEATNAALAAAGVPGITNDNSGNGGGQDAPPCGSAGYPVPWTGLLCDGPGGRVTQLLLSQLGPDSLPCDVGSLGDLAGLDRVQNVDFTGVGLKGKLPASWSKGFGSVEKLVLSQNNIEGGLPAEWADGFKKANTIDLNQNKLSGGLPSSWGSEGKLPALLNLVLGSNALNGDLPNWSGFEKLQLMGLSANELEGSLNSNWTFPALRVLELNDNGFTGCLPADWPSQLPKLDTLRVSNDQLSGNIPASYDDWDSLTTFVISPGNSICGKISAQLATKPPNGKGERKGNRFEPEPDTKTADGGYDLGSCDGASC